MADYERAFEFGLRKAVVSYNSGLARHAMGRYAAAISDYDWALALDPNYIAALGNRAVAKRDSGDFDGAISDYDRVIDLAPNSAVAYNSRGAVQQARGALAEARRDHDRAVEIDSKYALGYMDRGILRYQQKDWAGALADFGRTLDLSGEDVDQVQICVWLARSRLGERAAADTDLKAFLAQRAARVTPALADQVLAFLTGDLNESGFIAIATSAEAAKDRSRACAVWFFTGVRRLLAGDTTAAREYFQKALAADTPTSMEHWFARSELGAL